MKLTELIEQTFNTEGSLYLACNKKRTSFSIICGHVRVCDALHYLLDNTLIRFLSKLFRRIVGSPMVTKCALLNITINENSLILKYQYTQAK